MDALLLIPGKGEGDVVSRLQAADDVFLGKMAPPSEAPLLFLRQLRLVLGIPDAADAILRLAGV